MAMVPYDGARRNDDMQLQVINVGGQVIGYAMDHYYNNADWYNQQAYKAGQFVGRKLRKYADAGTRKLNEKVKDVQARANKMWQEKRVQENEQKRDTKKTSEVRRMINYRRGKFLVRPFAKYRPFSKNRGMRRRSIRYKNYRGRKSRRRGHKQKRYNYESRSKYKIRALNMQLAMQAPSVYRVFDDTAPIDIAQNLQTVTIPTGSNFNAMLNDKFRLDVLFNQTQTVVYADACLYSISPSIQMDLYNRSNIRVYCKVYWCVAVGDTIGTDPTGDPKKAWELQTTTTKQFPGPVTATVGAAGDITLVGTSPMHYPTWMKSWRVARRDKMIIQPGETMHCKLVGKSRLWTQAHLAQGSDYFGKYTVIPMIVAHGEMTPAASAGVPCPPGAAKLACNYYITYRYVPINWKERGYYADNKIAPYATTAVTVNPFTDTAPASTVF